MAAPCLPLGHRLQQTDTVTLTCYLDFYFHIPCMLSFLCAAARFRRIALRKGSTSRDNFAVPGLGSPGDAQSPSFHLGGKKGGVGGISIHRNRSQNVDFLESPWHCLQGQSHQDLIPVTGCGSPSSPRDLSPLLLSTDFLSALGALRGARSSPRPQSHFP